jgi:hypothetical protein
LNMHQQEEKKPQKPQSTSQDMRASASDSAK